MVCKVCNPPFKAILRAKGDGFVGAYETRSGFPWRKVTDEQGRAYIYPTMDAALAAAENARDVFLAEKE